jgi:putative zinc finger protein
MTNVTDPDSSLDAMLRALREPGVAEPAVHPTPEQLAAYCRGELTSEESEAIAAHLAWCRDDASFVLAFREISGLDPVEEESAEALDTAWEDFRRRRDSAVAGPSAPTPLQVPHPPRITRRRWKVPGTLAASLLLATLGAGGVAFTLARLHRSTEPQPNGQIVDLGATDEERAAGPELKEIVLQADEESLTVILHPTHDLSAKRFSVVLLDEGGKEIWQGDVRPMELDTFRVTFPRAFLSSAKYVLELRGKDDGAVAVLDRFPVRIVLRSSGASKL